MTTSNPRMMITVTPETKRIFEYTSGVMGIPAARLVTQVLVEAQSSILDLGKAMDSAKIDPVACLKQINEIVQTGHSKLDSANFELEQQLEFVKPSKASSKRKK